MHRLGLMLLISLLAIGQGWGQGLSNLSGTVVDMTGAVIPGAGITLENPSTGWRRTTESDEQGRYQVPQVPPGTYRLVAQTPGFNDVVVERVVLPVSSTITLNLEFAQLDDLTESVSVVADRMINTTDASIGNVISTTPIVQLPLFARNPANLLALQPGVTQFGATYNEDISGAVAGSKTDQSNVTLDGVDVNDQLDKSAFTSVLRVTLDSVQEFRSTTTNANADQGRTSGAQVTLVTKSGSNELHGSLYHFHRNTVTAANGFFNNRAGVARPKLLVNVFGGSVGGPVLKDKLFYFFNFEGRRDASDSTNVRVVPTTGFRQGNVQYLKRDGTVGTLNPDQVKAMDRLGLGANPAILRMFQDYPTPNDSTVGDGLNLTGFRFTAPTQGRENTYITRWDYAIDEARNHNLFVRGNLQNDRYVGSPQFPGLPPNSVSLNNSKGIAVGYNAVLSPTLIAVTRYGFTRQGIESTGVRDRAVVSFRNISSLVPTSTGSVRLVPTHTFSQDLTWIKGAHTYQFGFVTRQLDISRRSRENSYSGVNVDSTDMQDRGYYENQALPDLNPTFAGPFGDAITTMLGVITSGEGRYNFDIARNLLPEGAPISRSFQAGEYELYAQDTWRINRELNVVLGLRWSLMPPFRENTGQQITAVPDLQEFFQKRAALAEQGLPSRDAGLITYHPVDSPQGRDLYPFHKKNFAPRVAIAYSPQNPTGWRRALFGGPGKTSIRAGWGMFYDLFGSGLMKRADDRAPGFSFRLFTPGTFYSSLTAPRFTGIYDIPWDMLPSPPQPAWPVTLGYGAGETTTGLPNPNLSPPYSMNMNFSVSREFTGGWVVQGSYVGRLSRKTLGMVDIAQPVDFRDPESGQYYTEGVAQMIAQVKAGIPVAQVQPVPWFENVFSTAARDGLTATQYLYKNVYVPRAPARWMGIFPMDVWCSPVCSKYGQYTFFHPQYYALGMWDNVGNASYHAMQWTVRKRMGSRVHADFNYTWSKSIDLVSRPERSDYVYGAALIINSWDPGQMKAVSNFDSTHMVNTSWVVQLPFGKGEPYLSNLNTGLDSLLGGWQISGILFANSGLPSTVNSGFYPTNYNVPAFATQIADRPATNVSKDAPAVSGPRGPNVFADPAAALAAYGFSIPGESGQRNGIRGDKYVNLDLSLSKRFDLPYAEGHVLQFRVEAFNVMNSTYFGSPSLSLDSPGSFGRYTWTRSTPRQVQFALRYEF